MRVLFLLGAGISRGLLPLTTNLTKAVLDGQASDGRRAYRHSDARYYLLAPPGFAFSSVDYVAQVRALLTWLADSAREIPVVDYELLYFVSRQLQDLLSGDLENPLLQPFLERYLDKASQLGLEPLALAREATQYIGSVVAQSLTLTPTEGVDLSSSLRNAHKPLLEACHDMTATAIDVVTLNHDTLLEQSFVAAAVSFEDGFRAAHRRAATRVSTPEAQEWRGFRHRRGRVRLNKLHGSIDWWRVRRVGGDWYDECVARISAPSPAERVSFGGGTWEVMEGAPLILVGTFNKILDYAHPVHLSRFAVFRRALLKADALVVSGYSFRDKAINGMLTDWYYSRPSGNIVAIGPGLIGREPPRYARPAVAQKWDNWVREGRLAPIPLRFSDANWGQIKRHLRT